MHQTMYPTVYLAVYPTVYPAVYLQCDHQCTQQNMILQLQRTLPHHKFKINLRSNIVNCHYYYYHCYYFIRSNNHPRPPCSCPPPGGGRPPPPPSLRLGSLCIRQGAVSPEFRARDRVQPYWGGSRRARRYSPFGDPSSLGRLPNPLPPKGAGRSREPLGKKTRA